MLFMIQYKTFTGTNRAGQERFKQTGGAPPAAGVKKIAGYHYADGSGGFTLAESDVIALDARPVLTDEQMGQVLGG
jgi:hypothetical protein